MSKKISTSKTLRIKVNEIVFDAGTLTLPFISEYRLKDEKTGEKKYITSLTFEREVIRDGQPCISELKVKGDGELGVPTLKDKEIMIGLEKIFVNNNTVNGELILKKDPSKVTLEDRTIDFVSINYLALAMGYKGNINNTVKKGIVDGLTRLANTTWESIVGWHVHDEENNKRYYKSFKEGLRLISKLTTYTEEEIDENDKKVKGGSIDGDTKIVLSEEVYNEIATNNIVIFDDNINDKIKYLPSKNIYVVGKKWAGKNKTITVKLEKFEQVIPTIQEGKYKKQYIKGAINKLKSSEACRVYYLKNDVVTLDFRKPEIKLIGSIDDDTPNVDQSKDDVSYFKGKYNKWSEIVAKLEELGFENSEIKVIDPERMSYISALLRYIDTRVYAASKNKKLSIEKPKEFFISYYNNKYDIDEKYYTNR